MSTGKFESIKYGSGDIEGWVVNDDISISNSTATMATDVNFINVY